MLASAMVLMAHLLAGVEVLAVSRPDPVRQVMVPAVEAEADFDGDGHLDLVTESCDTDCEVDVALSAQKRSLRLDTKVFLQGVVAADVDWDGDVDLVTLDRTGALAIWTNEGGGRFTRRPRAPAVPAGPSHDPTSSISHAESAIAGQTRPSMIAATDSFATAWTPIAGAISPGALPPTAHAVSVRSNRGPPESFPLRSPLSHFSRERLSVESGVA